MSDGPDAGRLRWAGPPPGLCGGCTMARVIASDRGSTFLLCERSRTDRRFPRYPPLPVVACIGFAPLGRPPADPPRTPEPT